MTNKRNNLWRLFRRTKNEYLKIMYKQQQVACRLTSLNYKVNKVRSLYKIEIQKNSLNMRIKQWEEKNPPIFFKRYIYINCR